MKIFVTFLVLIACILSPVSGLVVPSSGPQQIESDPCSAGVQGAQMATGVFFTLAGAVVMNDEGFGDDMRVIGFLVFLMGLYISVEAVYP